MWILYKNLLQLTFSSCLTYWREIVTSGNFFTWKRSSDGICLCSFVSYTRLACKHDLWKTTFLVICCGPSLQPTPDCMLSFGVMYLHGVLFEGIADIVCSKHNSACIIKRIKNFSLDKWMFWLMLTCWSNNLLSNYRC